MTKVRELAEGTVLEKDIYINSSILYKSGTYITQMLINDLADRGIDSVYARDIEGLLNYDYHHISPASYHHLKALKERFQNDMSHIVHELKYGRALHSESSYKWIRAIYLRLFSNPSVTWLMDSLKQWDTYSYYHSVDVFVLSTLLARHYQYEAVDDFALGCLLHDIGKLGIPKSILLKKGKLTENEYRIVMEHTTYGYRLLKKTGFPERVCKLARQHHERLNGKGYPDGLTFRQLDKDLKIAMVADVYSALTLSRPYRKPMHATKALQILLRDSRDGQFDDNCCYDFINLLCLYPPATKVVLSDGRIGTIVNNPSGAEMLPIIRLAGSDELFQTPSDLSITIHSVVGWDNSQIQWQSQRNWSDYLAGLINGNKKAALKLLDELSDGKRVENVFVDIIERAIAIINKGVAENKLHPSDARIAAATTQTLLDWKMREFTEALSKEVDAAIVANLEGISERLPLRIVRDLMEINGWKIYYLGDLEDETMIVDLIQRRHIRYLAISLTKEAQILYIRRILENLLSNFPELTILVHGRYAHMLQPPQPHRIIASKNAAEFILKLHDLQLIDKSISKKF